MENETDELKAVLEKTQTQLRLELARNKDIAQEMSDLRSKMKIVEGEKEEGDDRRHPGEMRKIKLLEEQVQYLERRLESSRQESALKLSSLEGLLGNENSKLKAREKDLRRKLQREREANKLHMERVQSLTTELTQLRDEMKRKDFDHSGWMKHVRLPAKGQWPTIRLDSQQNKRALRHIFQEVEKEGGPPVNLDPSLFLHCVILFLWWRSQATLKLVKENEALSNEYQTNVEGEEPRGLNSVLQQRIKELEDALGDCRAERQAFETTMSTNLNQLLADKYDLSNKVARLEDTVSALHLDNNLLRGQLNDRSASRQAKMQLDTLTAELTAKLQASESELRRTCLLKEQMEIDLRQASRRLQTLEQDARIRDTVCREHTERLSSSDVMRAELEKTTSELQAKVWSFEHDLRNLEDSRNTLGKDRDSFLGQLTKALEELEQAREKIHEQGYQLKQTLDQQAHFTETLKHRDETIRKLQEDLANHREARAKLREEEEKRRSLEVISTNHEKLVRQMEERMRTDEVDSATLLAELCEAHSEERTRLEGRIEALEQEREQADDAIETMSTEKAVLQADAQRLKFDLERVSTKLHNILRRQALRVYQAPLPTALRLRESADVSTSTEPVAERSSPIGGEDNDDLKDRRVKDLEELIDLLVAMKESTFARRMFGVDGDAMIGQDIRGVVRRGENFEETMRRAGGEEEEEIKEEEEDNMPEHRSAKMSRVEQDVFAKFRALALLMRAKQKLRARWDSERGFKELNVHHASRVISGDVEGLDDITHPRCSKSDEDSHVLVNEPLITKQQQQLLFGPMVPSDSKDVSANVQNRPTGEQSLWRTGAAGSAGEDQDSDQSPSESDNEDLLSTLERERQRLKKELEDIQETEARVEEDLQREQEAHLLSLQRVNEYQEKCARMHQEKEELLREPHPEDRFTENEMDSDGRRSTLDVELERMFLEELESLKEENELLMTERLHLQKILDDQRESIDPNQQELETSVPLTISPRGIGVERPRPKIGEPPLVLEDQKGGSEVNVQELEMRTSTKFGQREADADLPRQPKKSFVGNRAFPSRQLGSMGHDTAQSCQEEFDDYEPVIQKKDKMASPQNRSLRRQPRLEALTNQGLVKESAETVLGEPRGAQQEPLIPQVDGHSCQKLENVRFLADDTPSVHENTWSHSARQESSSLSNPEGLFIESSVDSQPALMASISPRTHSTLYQPNISQQRKSTSLPIEFEKPVKRTLVNAEDVPIRSAIEALEQADVGRQQGERLRDGELDGSNGDDRVTVSSLSEPGDKPEADQCHDQYVLEAEPMADRRRNPRGLGRQNAMTEQGSGPEQRSPQSVKVPTAGAIMRNGRSYPKTRSKGRLQKQKTAEEEFRKDHENEASSESKQASEIGRELASRVKITIDDTNELATSSHETNPVKQDQHVLDSWNPQKGVQDLTKQRHKEERMSKSDPDYEKDFLECQAALLKLHQERHDLQNQLTEALQTDVKLQRVVESLRNRTDSLQASLNESAELVTALQRDKDFLKNNYNAAQEERRSFQADFQKVSKRCQALEKQLQECKTHAELQKKDHNALKKRYALERDRSVKLQRQIAKLENYGSKLTKSKQTPVGTSQLLGDDIFDEQSGQRLSTAAGNPNKDQQTKKKRPMLTETTALSNDDMPNGESRLPESPGALEQENMELRDQLTQTMSREVRLKEDVDQLRAETRSLLSRLRDSNDFTAELQRERDSLRNILTVAKKEERIFHKERQRWKTELEAAQREMQEAKHKTELLEIENTTLKARQTSDNGKYVKLQQKIEELEGERLDMRSQPRRDVESFENLAEREKNRHREEELKKQLEEQIERIFDLENKLDESKDSVRDLERERNMLQDDFTAALQARSELKTQLSKARGECQSLQRELDDSQARVESLKKEMGEYLEQDSRQNDEEVRLLRKKLRELRVDRQTLIDEHSDTKLRMENLEQICKMHIERQKRNEAEKTRLMAEIEKLQVENQAITARQSRHGKTEAKWVGDTEPYATSTGVTDADTKPRVGAWFARMGGHSTVKFARGSDQKEYSRPVACDLLPETRAERDQSSSTEEEGRSLNDTAYKYDRDMRKDDFSGQTLKSNQANGDGFAGFKWAHEDVKACSDHLQKLEQTMGSSTATLREELDEQTENISRLRESTETTLQSAVSKAEQLTEVIRQELQSAAERYAALRLKDTRVAAGHRLAEVKKLLDRSLAEQRKQATSISTLRQTMEKALLQHSALKIRLRQQAEKASGALCRWEKEGRSLKKHLGEVSQSLKLTEKRIISAVNQSPVNPELDAFQDQLLRQHAHQARALQRMIKDCPCQNEKNDEIPVSAENGKSQLKLQQDYGEPLNELKKENVKLAQDLRLTSDSLDKRNRECWRLQEALQDAELRERELTSTLRAVQDQLKIEVKMQAQLAKRSEDQEKEIFKLRSSLGRQTVKDIAMDQEQDTKPTKLNEMLSGFSREIQSHLEEHMQKTQLQNETDDRKKIQELEWYLSNMEARQSVDKITIQSLSDDNHRLRGMVYKLQERIASNQIAHHKDSRMDAVYRALARAQVRVIATSMADGSQAILTGADAFTNVVTPGFAASQLANRRHMGSAGSSLGDSYD